MYQYTCQDTATSNWSKSKCVNADTLRTWGGPVRYKRGTYASTVLLKTLCNGYILLFTFVEHYIIGENERKKECLICLRECARRHELR